MDLFEVIPIGRLGVWAWVHCAVNENLKKFKFALAVNTFCMQIACVNNAPGSRDKRETRDGRRVRGSSRPTAAGARKGAQAAHGEKGVGARSIDIKSQAAPAREPGRPIVIAGGLHGRLKAEAARRQMSLKAMCEPVLEELLLVAAMGGGGR